MKLPNCERAIVDLDKLTRYRLDPAHPRGRHKARVFRAALGIATESASVLHDALLRAAATEEMVPGRADRHGTRYTLSMKMVHGTRTAIVRSHWIVRQGEQRPRFVTCYVE